MSLVGEVQQAALGWLDLITGQKDVGGRFNASRAGIVNAIGCYLGVVLASMLIPAFWLGMPAYSQVFVGVVANCLPLAGVALAIVATRALLRLEASFADLFVPAVYALSLVLFAGLFFSFISPIFANSLLGVLGFMLFREARDIGKMSLGVSLAFALLGIAALVAPSFALYMLTVPAPAGA